MLFMLVENDNMDLVLEGLITGGTRGIGLSAKPLQKGVWFSSRPQTTRSRR